MRVVSPAPALVKQVSLAVVSVILLSAAGVHADPVEDAAPLPPWALTGESAGGSVELSWNAPPGPVDGYNVYRAPDAETVLMDGMDAFVLVGQTTEPAFQDDAYGVSEAVYVVTATLDNTESIPSNPATAVLFGYPYCLSVNTDCFLPPPLAPVP